MTMTKTPRQSPHLQLEQTNDYSIIKYNRTNSSKLWKGPLTSESFCIRDYKTSELEISQKTAFHLGLYNFTLRDLAIDSEDTGFDQIVAACETLNKRGIIAVDGVVKEIAAPSIGCVYTLPHHRKKGYAEVMIKEVVKYWKERIPEESFIFLYSEVGEFYAKAGFKTFEVPVHKIDVEVVNPEEVNAKGISYLHYDEFEELMTPFQEQVISEIKQKSITSSKPLYTVLPTRSQIAWFHNRDIHTGSFIGRPQEDYSRLGAKIDLNNYIAWDHVWGTPDLQILCLKATSLDNLQKLTNVAAKEAKITNFKQVYLWDSSIPVELKEEFLKWVEGEFRATKFNQPNGSVSAILPVDEGRRKTVNYVWENNDKWCWF